MISKIKIIAEIGINHNGDISQALNLIKAAAEAGVWGIKFQYRNLDNAYSDGANEIGDDMLLREIQRNYLSPESIIYLVNKTHDLGVHAGISFFEEADIDDFLDSIDTFDFFKAPSVELCNTSLVNKMLSFGKLVFVSLGCHNEIEIEQAFTSYESDNWIAMHCVSNYPVSIVNAKLGYLQHMANKWDRPFGYSSHDSNWEVNLIAMSMGATVIERHITFDKHADGLDHSTSSTPDEFRRMVMFAENMQLLISGNGARIPNQGEMLNLQNLGRSYYTDQNILAGEEVSINKLVFRSPRIGLGKTEMNQYFGSVALENLSDGDVISRSVFVPGERLKEEAIDFAKKHKIAIPVRSHDFSSMEQKFPIGAFEFHLSYGEVLSNLDADHYSASNLYSIHLPDYINPTQLMDPFSPNKQQASESYNILQRTVDFAYALQQRTGRNVPVVGSFSVVHKDLKEFYEQHAAMLAKFRDQGVLILPQWLPPVAWYFGGSVKLEAVNQQQDVDYISRYKLPICMDVCHLCMGDSVFNFNSVNMINSLLPLIKHVHIADAAGIDGEGLHFGEGDPKNLKAISKVMDVDVMKVIEVWQGHLDDGAGFVKALNKLPELF
jgi:sialic acid synthase SpsE/sugar phosphate isomerase/epimerase